MAFGFALLNSAPGTTITSITISFNQENWRTPTSASNNVLDGNLVANQVAKTFTFSSLNLAFNDRLFVRWQDVDNSGNDAGMGMDDMSLTFVTVPEAPAGALGAAACVAAGLAGAWRWARAKKA